MKEEFEFDVHCYCINFETGFTFLLDLILFKQL